MFAFLGAAIGFIVSLFQGGIDAIVTTLVWAVSALQAGAILLWNGIRDLGKLLKIGFVNSWDFLSDPWDNLFKPAWLQFWKWFDKLRAWLNDTFGPVLDWLKDLRKQLLDFWKTYVRPWLDLIDVTRKLLNVLASLGLSWARALDQRLGQIEDAITKPFLFLVGKLNEVINVVNQIAGLDGLLQRVALVRSIARDYQLVWNAITLPYLKNQTPPKDADTSTLTNPKSIDAIVDDTTAYLDERDSPIGAVVDEAAAQFGIYLRS